MSSRIRIVSMAVMAAGLAAFATVLTGAGDVERSQVTQPQPRVPLRNNQAPIPGPALPANHSTDAARYVGVQSCAASNCHGGGGTKPTWRNAYSIWIQQDPHSLAVTALYGSRSLQMAKQLGLGVPPYEAEVCLACHAVADDAGIPVAAGIVDGVSCEACHGPARNWLEPHKRLGWDKLAASERAELGFIDTENLLARAELCAKCHVGSPGRDVNHDLIAAGHPPLKFELSSYHARLPKHWDEAAIQDKSASELVPVMDAQLWAIGQFVSASASARLLANRAANEKGPWPELAEYSCFDCHHGLKAESWRRQRSAQGRRPGTLEWASWYPPLVTTLAADAGFQTDKLSTSLESLKELMAKPYPPPGDAAEHASALADELDLAAAGFAGRTLGKDDFETLIGRLTAPIPAPQGAGPKQTLASGGWDSAAQVYLALAAIQRSRLKLGLPDDGLTGQLEAIREQLRFRKHNDVRYDSPEHLEQKHLDEINRRLAQIYAGLQLER